MSSSSGDLIGVVNDGPESYYVLRIAHPWEVFALAKWKSLASTWECKVDFVGRGRAWHWTTIENTFSFSGNWLLQVEEPPSDQWFWRPDLLEARGFSKWVDFTIELSPWDYNNELHFNVDIELTTSGIAKALQYAKGLIEEECRKEGKPVPWDGLQ
jgi:hypothetical protein